MEKFDDHLRYELGRQPNTAIGYLQDLQQLLTYLEDLLGRPARVADLREVERLRGYVVTKQKHGGLSAATVARHCAAIRALLGYLADRGKLPGGISAQIQAPRVRRKKPRYLSRDQAASLLDPQPRQRPILHARDTAAIACLYEGELRASEVCSLDTDSVVWDCGRPDAVLLRVLGKGGDEGVVPLLYGRRSLEAYLARRCEFAHCRERALFVTQVGRRLTRSGLWRIVQSRGRTLPPEVRAHPHKLRVTGAAWMLMLGAELRAVQEHLRHADPQQTAHYTPISTEHLIAQGVAFHPLNFVGPKEDRGLQAMQQALAEQGALVRALLAELRELRGQLRGGV